MGISKCPQDLKVAVDVRLSELCREILTSCK